MKKIMVLIVLVMMLCGIASAEVAPVLRLNGIGRVIVRDGGGYFFQIGKLQIDGTAKLQQSDCAVSLVDIQPNYRIVISGNGCNGTGKAVLQLFGVGTYSITDNVIDK